MIKGSGLFSGISHANLDSQFDVITIKGNGASYNTLKEAGIEDADLLIAVTGIDEENILLTLFAKRVSKAKVITKINRINSSDVITASVFIVSFDNKGLITSFTAVAATINNIGPGLELAGPTQNYASFSTAAKFTMIFDMLAGRLELFPMLMLFNPKLYVTKPLLSHKAK